MVSRVIYFIATMIGILLLINLSSAINTTSNCKNLYWIDNTNKNCESKEFCGAFMYYGLQTFASKELCQKATNSNDNKECTADAKLCDDGTSYVGRNGSKNCQFDECPIDNKNTCNTDSDCKLIYDGCGCLAVPKTDSRNRLEGDIQCIWNECLGKNVTSACINNKCKRSDNNDKTFKLSNGRNAEIKVMPESASAKAIERLGELGFNITIKEVGKGNETHVVYNLEAEKDAKLFGFINNKAKVEVEVDAENDGKVLSVKKPWWAFLASGI